MRNSANFGRVFLGMLLGFGLLFSLSGCEDEAHFRKLANEKIAIADRQLKEARDMGAPTYAGEAYSLAEIKYSEGKQHMEAKQYAKAFRDWEDFEFLISKAKSETKEKKPVEVVAPVAKIEVVKVAPAPAPTVAITAPTKNEVAAPVPVLKVEAVKVVETPTITSKRPADGGWIVKKGDHLYKISRQLYRNNFRRWAEIYKLNNRKIKNPNLIYPGQEFQLPKE